MEAILEQLVRSPKLRLYVDELTETLRREQESRERFRENLNEDVRAEFINGVVFMHSPARKAHNTTVGYISRLLSTYVDLHRLGAVCTEQALTAFTRNDYAPDICFWGPEKAAAIDDDTFYFPIPDFICEVLSPSTEQNDRGVKLEDYAAHGVREYWIIDPDRRTIEPFTLKAGQYPSAPRQNEGLISSLVIQGFSMAIEAAFDEQANLKALRQILAAPAE